jgi:hypothetical protein
MTRNEVHKVLGPCEAWSLEDGSEAEAKVWKYGIIQIWFRDSIVSYIGLYPEFEPELSQNPIFEGYFPTPSTTLSEIEKYLQREKLSYSLDQNFKFGTKLLLEANVNLVFNEDETIHSIYILK